MIERAIINVQTGRDVLEPGTFVHDMPQPCYMDDRCVTICVSVCVCVCVCVDEVFTVIDQSRI